MSRRLAYFHLPSSFSWMMILAAAQGVCDLIWVIDSSWDEDGTLARVLGRSGPVVDIAGMDAPAVAAAIAQHQPDAILTLADSRLVLTAEVAEILGLAFLSRRATLALTDKWAQREALADGGVPTPGVWQIPVGEAEGAAETFWASVRFPALLKPRQGEASRDIVRVDSAADLRRELEALEAVRGSRENLIVEEFIPDRPEDLGETFAGYVSVESLTSQGQTKHLTITGRFPPAPPFRETGYFMPSALSDIDAAAVLAAASAAIRAVGVEIGACHTEVKLTPDGPRVIEINGRIGGGISEMIQDLTGYEFLKEAIAVALGAPLNDEPGALPEIAYLLYLQAPAGMSEVTEVTGLNELQAIPGVHEVILNRGPGQRVDWREGNHGNVCSIRGTASSHEELADFALSVPTRVRISGR